MRNHPIISSALDKTLQDKHALFWDVHNTKHLYHSGPQTGQEKLVHVQQHGSEEAHKQKRLVVPDDALSQPLPVPQKQQHQQHGRDPHSTYGAHDPEANLPQRAVYKMHSSTKTIKERSKLAETKSGEGEDSFRTCQDSRAYRPSTSSATTQLYIYMLLEQKSRRCTLPNGSVGGPMDT